MANNKPSSIGYVIKGKLISAVNGFTDTFNWIADFCNNFKAESPLKVENINKGKPVIKMDDDEFGNYLVNLMKNNSTFRLQLASAVVDAIDFNSGDGANIEVEKNENTVTIDVHYL